MAHDTVGGGAGEIIVRHRESLGDAFPARERFRTACAITPFEVNKASDQITWKGELPWAKRSRQPQKNQERTRPIRRADSRSKRHGRLPADDTRLPRRKDRVGIEDREAGLRRSELAFVADRRALIASRCRDSTTIGGIGGKLLRRGTGEQSRRCLGQQRRDRLAADRPDYAPLADYRRD